MSNKKKFEKIKAAKEAMETRIVRLTEERDGLRVLVNEIWELYDLDNVSVISINDELGESEENES